MNIHQKYAELQRTVWPEYANTTLGNLPAEMFNQIEAAYAKQIAQEQNEETAPASVPTPEVEFPTGDIEPVEIKSPDDLTEEVLIAQVNPSGTPDMGATGDDAGKDQAYGDIQPNDSMVKGPF